MKEQPRDAPAYQRRADDQGEEQRHAYGEHEQAEQERRSLAC